MHDLKGMQRATRELELHTIKKGPDPVRALQPLPEPVRVFVVEVLAIYVSMLIMQLTFKQPKRKLRPRQIIMSVAAAFVSKYGTAALHKLAASPTMEAGAGAPAGVMRLVLQRHFTNTIPSTYLFFVLTLYIEGKLILRLMLLNCPLSLYTSFIPTCILLGCAMKSAFSENEGDVVQLNVNGEEVKKRIDLAMLLEQVVVTAIDPVANGEPIADVPIAVMQAIGQFVVRRKLKLNALSSEEQMVIENEVGTSTHVIIGKLPLVLGEVQKLFRKKF